MNFQFYYEATLHFYILFALSTLSSHVKRHMLEVQFRTTKSSRFHFLEFIHILFFPFNWFISIINSVYLLNIYSDILIFGSGIYVFGNLIFQVQKFHFLSVFFFLCRYYEPIFFPLGHFCVCSLPLCILHISQFKKMFIWNICQENYILPHMKPNLSYVLWLCASITFGYKLDSVSTSVKTRFSHTFLRITKLCQNIDL